MTLVQALNLKYRDVVHEEETPMTTYCKRWFVNGKVKTWKRNLNIRIPVKHGLYRYGYLTEHDLDSMHLESECPYTAEKALVRYKRGC